MNSGKRSGAEKTEGVLESIRKLRDEKPKSLMGQIRWMMPDIEAALDSGHSLTDIHAMLNQHGIEIPYKQLSLYMGRIRREEEKKPRRLRDEERSAPSGGRVVASPESSTEAVTTLPTPPGEKVPLLRSDPLANLRQKKPSVPNFSGTANKEDLY